MLEMAKLLFCSGFSIALLLLYFSPRCNSGEIGDYRCYYIIGIPGSRNTVNDVGEIALPSDVPTLSTVFQLHIPFDHRKRRRKRGVLAGDVYLINSSSTFGLRWNISELQHEMYTKTCLTAGYTETLQLGISDRRDYGGCSDSDLKITISAAIPKFDGENSEVHVDPCSNEGTIVEVFSLMFSNNGNCVKTWNCTINSTNDKKRFWIADGTIIHTYVDDIDFTKEYEIEVTCVENGTATTRVPSDNKHTYYIKFMEHTSTCTTSPVTHYSTKYSRSKETSISYQGNARSINVGSSVQTLMDRRGLDKITVRMLQTTKPFSTISENNDDEVGKSFFESTIIVATISAIGGISVGAVVSAVLFTMAKSYIVKK